MRLRSLCLIVFTCAAANVFADEIRGKSARNSRRMDVAVVIFDGVELLDFAGPAEVFVVAGNGSSFRVFTVSHNRDPIRTMGGIRVTPEYSFDNVPKVDIVVVPGGNTGNVGKAGIEWLQKTATEVDVIMSVCMGAFLLAEAGLLDELEVTTHRWGIEGLKRAAPDASVVRDRRFVDSGKILTTAGVTAGIDGALHLVERFFGKEAARWTAEEWMEYRSPN